MATFSSQAHYSGPRLSDSPTYASPRSAGFGSRAAGLRGERAANSQPSLGRRFFRGLVRFVVAVLIGVGGTLAWQSHGEEATEFVRTWAPSLVWLLPAATNQAPAADSTSPELTQQLDPMARDLAAVRRIVEQLVVDQTQLAAKQQQIAQELTALQSVGQDIREKTSAPTPARPARAAPRKLAPAGQQSSVQ